MNVLSLFDGMSCGRIALERVGISVDKYYSSEIDEPAIKVANFNYPQDKIYRLGDVTKLTDEQLKKLNIDILIGGSPCQGFSVAGKRKGSSTKEGIDVTSLEQYLQLKEDGFEFDGQSYLFWEYIRILRITKPKYFLLENVRVSKKWINMFNEAIEVEPIYINSNLVSAQNRPRFYWTNIPNVTLPKDKEIKVQDILEDIPMTKPLSNYMTQEFDGVNRLDKGIFTFTNSDKACCLTTGGGHGNKYLLDRDKEVQRKLTVLEMERLQTLPEGYTNCVGKGQAGKMIGNGWTVDVIAHILSFIPEEDR
jgi:DNA (cytosine-5)-methyltransferase 3A